MRMGLLPLWDKAIQCSVGMPAAWAHRRPKVRGKMRRPKAASGGRQKMARILIAEDDVATRMVAGKMLEKMGHIPVFSPDGQHALETLQIDAGIQLLVTDVMMPRMDGRALIKTLRGTERHRKLPVIVISAVVGPREIADLLDLGASRFQPKPLDMGELRENIELALRDFNVDNKLQGNA